MKTLAAFNLTDTIRVLDNPSLTTEENVTAFIAAIDPQQYEEALRQALGRVIFMVRNEESRRAFRHVVASPAGSAAPVSRKVQLLREQYWPAFLLSVIPTESGPKAFGNATATDLLYAADQRRAHAAESIAEAEKYEALATLMMHKKVAVLSEMPIAEIESAYF